MTKPITRYTGQLDSSPEQVRCINHLLEQPGTGSVWKVTIEPIESCPVIQGLTLATLCDIVLGEDAEDRSDDALVKAVAKLARKGTEAPHA